MIRVALPGLVLCLLAACASTAPPPAQPAFDAVAAVAAIRAAGTASATELVIKPLGSRQVDDLREQAAALEAQGRPADAAAALDQALAISPDDPVLLQERAEAALLLHDLAGAGRLARRALAIGTDVGPQCRRHWETLVQLLAATQAGATGGAAAADMSVADARRQRDACTVAAPPRY